MTNHNSPFLSDEMLLNEFGASTEWMNEVEEPNYEFENDYRQENESPFLFEDRPDNFWNSSRSQNEFELDQEMVQQLMYELHDHEFSKAIYDVASEIRARVNTPFLLNEFDYEHNDSPNAIAERYLTPLRRQTEGYFNHLMATTDDRDVRNYSNYEIENLFNNYAFEGELDDKQEYFFKKFKEKAKKVIEKVKKVAKKVGKFLPMKMILKALGKIVMPLIQKVIQLGISKLPANVRPIAVELADKLFKKAKKKVADITGEEDTQSESDGNNIFVDNSINKAESTENQSVTEETADSTEAQTDPEAVQSADAVQEEINGAFIQSLMGYETYPTTENLFFEGETYENEFFEGKFEEETDIESARQNFIYELSNLEKGESPEPAIQNFLPVVMKFAKPAIKMALKFIGREKIVDIVAKLAAKLISKFIGEEKALTLSRHLVDAGFKKFLNFEVEDATPNAEIAYEVIADVVQEVARRVSNLPEEALMNEELLTHETNIAFEQAAAAIFPDNLIRYESREAQNTNGVWQSVQMPNGSRKYRKYSQIFDVNLDKNRLKFIRTFGGERLTDFLTNKMGVSLNGQNARIHLYEAMPDCMLSEIAINETAIPSLGTSGEESYGQFHPLTPTAAAVLLNEFGLASDDDDKYLQNRHTIREGQRFYVLEMDGVGRMNINTGFIQNEFNDFEIPTICKLTLIREKFFEDTTIGKLYINGEYFCDTLEDRDRGLANTMTKAEITKIKVHSNTAIPVGTYKVDRNEISKYPSTKKPGTFRLLNVNGFDGILIHTGNHHNDTIGCILVGKYTGKKEFNNLESVINSTDTFKRLKATLIQYDNVEITVTRKGHQNANNVSNNSKSYASNTIGSSSKIGNSKYPNQSAFIQKFANDFIISCKGTGLFPSVMMAQACTETGYGKYGVSHLKVNNLFGIKANSAWNGKVISTTTKEEIRGVKQTFVGTGKVYPNRESAIKQGANYQTLFRAYDTLSEGIKDRNSFLNNNDRYRKAGVFNAKSPLEQISAIKKAGYATDSNYVKANMWIINTFQLNNMDK